MNNSKTIHEAGDPKLVSNYRPISILPTLSNIFEKIAHKRLYEFLPKFNIFHESQIGFRSGHSTEMPCHSFYIRYILLLKQKILQWIHTSSHPNHIYHSQKFLTQWIINFFSGRWITMPSGVPRSPGSEAP